MDYFGAMRRAVTRTGLPIELKRVDLMEGDYEISQRLMDAIREADVLLADFTLSSANVYFELGYARGQTNALSKPLAKTHASSSTYETGGRSSIGMRPNWKRGLFSSSESGAR